MKYIITALLSAALIWLLPSGKTPVNNSETKVAHTAKAEQPVKAEGTDVTVAKAETPQPQTPESQPEPQPTPRVEVAQPLSDKESLMQQAGIPQSDWAATDYIVSHESSWNSAATNPSSGAYGLCQALPASKMASAGDDYKSNPVTQLKWCHDYANSRYGGWWKSFAYWQANRWW